MNGLERAAEAYEVFGKPLIDNEFAAWRDRIAVGLVGEGSDCRGYDDKTSLDHDNQVGLCLWITSETDAAIGDDLRKAYGRMLRRMNRGAVENPRRGVQVIPDFYRRFTGLPGAPETWRDWMRIPSSFLSDATNGIVFCDSEGVFSAIRKELTFGCPEDVRLKKLAGGLALAAQAGQYNYQRCIKHNEPGAAAMALAAFVEHASQVIFLLNYAYAPYYKWVFRAMRDLPLLGEEADFFTGLLTNPAGVQEKERAIEDFAGRITSALSAQGLTDTDDVFLEMQAKAVTKRISDPEIAALHLMDC